MLEYLENRRLRSFILAYLYQEYDVGQDEDVKESVRRHAEVEAIRERRVYMPPYKKAWNSKRYNPKGAPRVQEGMRVYQCTLCGEFFEARIGLERPLCSYHLQLENEKRTRTEVDSLKKLRPEI